MVSAPAIWLLMEMFSAPKVLKLCFAASQRIFCISLYMTLDAFWEKNHESAPRPPVRSATVQLARAPSSLTSGAQSGDPVAIRCATSDLYRPVALLLHCSADSFKGNMRLGLSCHSGIFPLSFLLLSMQFTARSISVSGYLFLSRINLETSSVECSAMNFNNFSIRQQICCKNRLFIRKIPLNLFGLTNMKLSKLL